MRIFSLSFVIASTIISLGGCSLKLCDEGEVKCTYGRLTDCGDEEDCSCDLQTDKNCVEIKAKSGEEVQCQLKICQSDAWQSQVPCKHGFDGDGCIPECQPDEVKCTNSHGQNISSYQSEACILRACDGSGQWSESSKNCEHGYDGVDCIPECRTGEVVCLDESGIAVTPDLNISCSLKRCSDKQWPELATEVCKFGYSGVVCIDPCVINDIRYESLAALSSQQSASILKCYASTGWEIDTICTNDFSFEDSDAVVDIPEWAYSDSLKKSGNNPVVTGLKPGKCGECNSDNTPNFCTTLEESKKYIHQCFNGQIQIKEDTANACAAFKETCTDSYGQKIDVDTNTNRYHCGKCEQVCSSSQYCSGGLCVSRVTKDDCVDGYATFQTNGRLVRAYCIHNLEDFKKIGSRYPEDNYDNAYILVNEDVWELTDWTPIETFNGLLFGNGKTIKVRKFMDYEAKRYVGVGIFENLVEAYIEDLILEYTGQESLEIKSERDILSIDVGLLAGHAQQSILKNIRLKSFINNIVLPDVDQDLYELNIGGLIGSGYYLTASDISLQNMNLSTDFPTPEYWECAIGGVVGKLRNGYANNIQLSHISINGEAGIGGLAGIAEDNAFNSLQAIDLNIAGNSKVGGMIGDSRSNTFSDVQMEQIKMEGEESIGGMIGESNSDAVYGVLIKNVEISDIIDGARSVGGMLGYASNVQIDLTELSDISITETHHHVDDAGGLAGWIRSGQVSNSSVNHVTIDASTGVGGLLGSANDTHIRLTHANDINIIKGWYTGGLIGNASNVDVILSQVSVNIVEGKYRCGGLIGGLGGSCNISGNVVEFNLSHPKHFDAQSDFYGGLIGQLYEYDERTYVTISACAVFSRIDEMDIPGIYENHVGGVIGNLYQNNEKGKSLDVVLNNFLSATYYALDDSGSYEELYSFVGYVDEQIDGGSLQSNASGYALATTGIYSYPQIKLTDDSSQAFESWSHCDIDITKVYSSLSESFDEKFCQGNKNSCYAKKCSTDVCGVNEYLRSYPTYKDVKCDYNGFKSLYCINPQSCSLTPESMFGFKMDPDDSTKFIIPAPVYVENSTEYVIKPSFCEEISK